MKNKILLVILFLFFATRLYKISSIPSSVYWDEASIGYNAYAISQDLKDEWGSFLPLHFRAFGEFKLPVYIYTATPFVKILGLNAYAVRLPAVFYTAGLLVLVYLITKKITNDKNTALFSSFILSLSPWLFIFSRTGYEATAGLFFFFLATYLLLTFQERKINILLATLTLIASFYSYNSFRIIAPIWFLMFIAYRYLKINPKRKDVAVIAVSLILFIISAVPVYRLNRFDTGSLRFAQVGVTKPLEVVGNYFSHITPSFLFFKGDTNPRSQVPNRGQLYLMDAPFILLGFFVIIKRRKKYIIPLIGLLLAFIPAAITKESPHALRAILAAPMLAIISSFGVVYLINLIGKQKKYITYGIIVFYLVFFGYYFRDFIDNYNAKTKDAWQYQYKEIFTKQTDGVITDEYAQPYIFALYYLKYSPKKFRQEVVYNPPDKWGFSLVSSFNGFTFK